MDSGHLKWWECVLVAVLLSVCLHLPSRVTSVKASLPGTRWNMCHPLSLVWIFLFSVFDQHHPRIHEFLGYSWSLPGLRCVSTAALEWGSYPDAPVENQVGWVWNVGFLKHRAQRRMERELVSLRSCCNINLIVLGSFLSNAVEASSPCIRNMCNGNQRIITNKLIDVWAMLWACFYLRGLISQKGGDYC